jgi:hypothetical protein
MNLWALWLVVHELVTARASHDTMHYSFHHANNDTVVTLAILLFFILDFSLAKMETAVIKLTKIHIKKLLKDENTYRNNFI